MFEIVLRDPESTFDNPFNINFLDAEIPPVTSKTATGQYLRIYVDGVERWLALYS